MLLFFNHMLLLAANDNFPMGARALGMGNAAVANEDVWSHFNNVAGTARLDKLHFSSFAERRYNFSAFDRVAAVGAVPLSLTPVKYGCGSFGLHRLGNEYYNETRLNTGYAHNIMGVNLGIQLEYAQVAIQEWGSKGNLIINFGGQAQITKHLRFGAHIYNISQAKIAVYEDERVPTIMKAGLSYSPSKSLMLNCEVEKDIEKQTRFKAGVEYVLIEKIFLRTGINVNPEKYFFGMGFTNKQLSIGYAVTVHQQLGLCHALGLGFTFHSRKLLQATSAAKE